MTDGVHNRLPNRGACLQADMMMRLYGSTKRAALGERSIPEAFFPKRRGLNQTRRGLQAQCEVRIEKVAHATDQTSVSATKVAMSA